MRASQREEGEPNEPVSPEKLKEILLRQAGRMHVPVGSLAGGDTFTVTTGQETYYPVKYNGYTVGPVSHTTSVRAGESAEDAWMRASLVCELLFEAEFQVKTELYFKRLREVRLRARRQLSES